MTPQEIVALIARYMEQSDIVVVPMAVTNHPDRIFMVLPASEATPHQCAGLLSRAKICGYRDVDYVDAMEGAGSERIMGAFRAAMPDGFTILSVEIKNIKVRNIPTPNTDD